MTGCIVEIQSANSFSVTSPAARLEGEKLFNLTDIKICDVIYTGVVSFCLVLPQAVALF